jgi:hypothetical protein
MWLGSYATVALLIYLGVRIAGCWLIMELEFRWQSVLVVDKPFSQAAYSLR